jgi:hypothetical protein
MLATLLLSALSSASPDPYSIFERAAAVWQAQRYPSVVAYIVDVEATHNGFSEHRHYHEYWSAYDIRTFIKPPVSDEQLLHPYVPSAGVNFMGWNIGGPRTGTGARDFIGPPLLAPNYSFGIAAYTPPQNLTPSQIVEEIRREYHDPAPAKVDKLAQQSGLKTIAVASVSAHVYRIALAGIEPGAGGRDFHLTLQPLRDPLKYRLRDLWIDVATYRTDRARIAGNFTDTAMEQVPWMVRFRQVGGATYIASEDAQAPIVGYHGPMYSQYSVSFAAPQPTTLPAMAEWTGVPEPLVEP